MSADRPTIAPHGNVWALLVGIDEYAAEAGLSGCANDVEAMEVFLRRQVNVPPRRIRVLKNRRATRARILQAFREFLIENADIRVGDQILFHFSGHGSQMRDRTGTEPDGLNETLVAYDSRTPGVWDIPDKTVAALLDQLAARKGDHITVILDSCHSGSGTRRLQGPGVARTRRIPADDRLPPIDLDHEIVASVKARGAGPSGWASGGIPYVLLAGCRDREESNEYQARDEQDAVWHGALTYFTLQHLRTMAPGTTYAELHEQVAGRVNAVYPNQMPQCEGGRDRVIFGGVSVETDPFIAVQKVEGDAITLGAGLVHGLLQGTGLNLYQRVRTRDELPAEPVATAVVEAASATTARARRTDGPGGGAIELPAIGVITTQIYVGSRQTVALEAAAGDQNRRAIDRLRQTIQPPPAPASAPATQKPSPYLIVADAPDAAADMRVRAAEGTLSIYGADGQLLVVPEEIRADGGDALGVRQALEKIARFRLVQQLDNQAAASKLRGKIRVALRRAVGGPEAPRAEEVPAGSAGEGNELTLYYNPDDPDGNDYVIDVINESPLSVYPHIFIMNPDYSIYRLYPTPGINEELKAKGARLPDGSLAEGRLTSGLNPGGSVLELSLPGDQPGEPRWEFSHDYLKVIVTTEPTDLRLLEQEPLAVPFPQQRGVKTVRSPLDDLIDTVVDGAGRRSGRPKQIGPAEDWATATLPLTVVRAYRTTDLPSDAGEFALADGLTLRKPVGFRGRVTVATLEQAKRGAAGDPGLKPPPGLERFPDLFQPVRLPGTRGVGPAGVVLALEVDEASRRSITPANPLRLEIPALDGEEAADLIPVAFDGEDYLLVGYAGDRPNVAEVVDLPPAVVPPDAHGQPARRGLGRTIRLFIYKKLGRYTPQVGLRRAHLVDGRVEYGEVRPDQFQAGQRVAVFVHGFNSDTGWMIAQPAQFLMDQPALAYDHLLAWDYETFGTGVQDTGEAFALALKQRCGFRPDDGVTVDVYAHSLGCLVARCMIELADGYAVVDRLVMAGPPNNGTTLAAISRGLIYLLTAAINAASVIPPVGMASKAIRALYEQGLATADLAVDSPVARRLNALDSPSDVRYLVLAGANLGEQGEQARFSRLARKLLDRGLDALFGEQNDAVIGLSSMRAVRGGAYPRLRVAILPCDHFSYFALPEGLAIMREWLLA